MAPASLLLWCVHILAISITADTGTCASNGGGACAGLRFKIGDTILVNMGQRDGWKAAEVVKLHQREPHWPQHQVAPYMVQLADEGMAYVPEDDPRLVREATQGESDRLRQSLAG